MRILSVTVLLLAASTLTAQSDKPVKWEYAELVYRSSPPRLNKGDADGKDAGAAAPNVTIQWTTGAGEVTLKGWDELAEKLKASFKKEGSLASQKIQVLNALGAEGWEMMEQLTSNSGFPSVNSNGGRVSGPAGTTTWLFKRRVP